MTNSILPSRMSATTNTPIENSSAAAAPRLRRGFFVVIVFAVLIAAAGALSLNSVEFNSTVERLNIATALETRRDGHWLLPTLNRELRLRKPPLVTWMTALAIKPSTIAGLSDVSDTRRNAAIAELATEARLPSLLWACAALIALYPLAWTVLRDQRIALWAPIIAGTSALFQFHSRQAILDNPLLLLTTLASLGIALAVFDRRIWTGCLLAGVSLGLAAMVKGPVALVQSILPALVFLIWRRWTGGVSESRYPKCALPLITGIAMVLLIGGFWFVLAALRSGGGWRVWGMEIFRTDPSERSGTPIWSYLAIVPSMFPWIIFLIAGLSHGFAGIRRGNQSAISAGDRAAYAVLMLIVPLIVMSCVRDRKVRYLVPLAAPAAIVAAMGAVRCYTWTERNKTKILTHSLHWLALGGVLVAGAFLLASGHAVSLTTSDGSRIISWDAAAIYAGVGALVVIALAILTSRKPTAMVLGTAGVMLGSAAFLWPIYARARDAKSTIRPLAAMILDAYPNAEMYQLLNPPNRKAAPDDLPIYMNRASHIAKDLSAVPPVTTQPQVIVVMQPRDEELEVGGGWKTFGTAARGLDNWVALVREPTIPASSNPISH